MRNHSLMRIAGGITIGLEVWCVPLIYYYGYHYYKNPDNPAPILIPLAPRTTEATRSTLARAQESTEVASCESHSSIWAGDIKWCREAIRRAHEFVTAITGAPSLDEAEQAEATTNGR